MDENQLAAWLEKIKQAQMREPMNPAAALYEATKQYPEPPKEQNWLRQFVNPDQIFNATPGRKIPLHTIGVRG